MPTYVYLCGECGNRKEEYRTISKRDDEMICSACGAKMDRTISAGASFNLKGDGFYKKGWQ